MQTSIKLTLAVLAAAAAFALPDLALGADGITLKSDILTERTITDASGKRVVRLEKLESGPPGTRLVFVHDYRNASPAPVANFGITNPLPPGVAFDAALSPGSEVSVDGGKTWGALAAARIALPNGTRRAATGEDVTHIRWLLKQPVAAGAGGSLRFRGIVR